MVALLFGACQGEKANQNNQPNILLILADDSGYSDLGSYGSQIRTPNLDRLAGEGIRFTRFYNSARCSPTRGSLLTGLYPHQAGIGYLTSGHANEIRETLGAPGYLDYLSENSVTIAEALKPAGYKTYHVGKWHVGQYRPHWPVDRGFDKSQLLIRGYHYFNPGENEYAEDDQRMVPEGDNFYSTDYFTESALEYIDGHNSDEPFFMYLAYKAPHWPLHAPESEIAKYQGKFMDGWDSLRARRFRRMKELGVIDRHSSLSPRHEHIPAWNSLSGEEKRTWDRKMAVYAAQISIMDRGIGQVMDLLQEKGMKENTLVFFLQDNGGSAEYHNSGDPNAKIGSPESWQSYGAWANLSDTPFRLFKRDVHEGGIATPLIAHWPAGITRSPEDLVREQGHLIDIMATCLDVAGAGYPKEYNGNEIIPLEGKSLVPYFKGKNPVNHETLYFEHEGNRALMEGNWKIVSEFKQPWELYNITKDRSELHNLTSEHPSVVQELRKKWQRWADKAGVVPWDKTGRNHQVYDYRSER